MKINLNGLTRNLNRFGLTIKKHSPEILMVAGTVGVVTSAVMACKATLKVNDILDEAKSNIDKIHNVAEDKEFADRYSEEDSKKDLTIVYAQTGIKLIKLYGPSILLGALSIGAMISSNRILTKRNIALAAAYTAVDTGFKDYRKNVVERFGEKVDKELNPNPDPSIIYYHYETEYDDIKYIKLEDMSNGFNINKDYYIYDSDNNKFLEIDIYKMLVPNQNFKYYIKKEDDTDEFVEVKNISKFNKDLQYFINITDKDYGNIFIKVIEKNE